MAKYTDFEEFKMKLAEAIVDYLPESLKQGEIRFSEVTKSGLGTITGMTIATEGSAIAPCLYINSAFEDHKAYGSSIASIAESMAEAFSKAVRDAPSINEVAGLQAVLQGNFNWDTVSSIIQVKAVPATDNDIIIHGNVSLIDFLLSIDTVDKEEQQEMEFRCRYVIFQDYKASVVGVDREEYVLVGAIMPVIPELEEFFMPIAVRKEDGKMYLGFLGLRDYESAKAAKMMNPEVIEELIVEGRMYAETWYGIQYALMKQKDGEMPFALYQERHPES